LPSIQQTRLSLALTVERRQLSPDSLDWETTTDAGKLAFKPFQASERSNTGSIRNDSLNPQLNAYGWNHSRDPEQEQAVYV